MINIIGNIIGGTNQATATTGYRVGTGAHSVTQLEAAIATLPAGTQILFKKGETFETGDITIPTNTITVGAYGTGAAPKLKGSVDIGAQVWTSEGSNVWSTPYSGTLKWLFVNGIAAQLAESPWYTITAQPSSTTLRATTLISAWGSSIVGCDVVIREYYFTYSFKTTVTAYDNVTGQITLNDAVRFPSSDFLNGFTFKLFNQQQFINTAGEYFYDTSAHKIYYRTSGSSPAGTDIRVCTKDAAFHLNDGVTDFTCSGIEFTQYFNSAINGKTNHRTSISSCNINNIRTNGLFLYGPATGVNLNDNTFSKCGQNGMLVGGLISPNVLRNTLTTMGRELTIPFSQKIGSSFADWEQTQGCGIVFTYDKTSPNYAVSGGTVQTNNVSDCAYCGINFVGSLTEVSYNRVDLVMQDLEDGGGIYCVGNPQSPYFAVTSGTTIKKYIVSNVKGVYNNCPLVHSALNSWGIYVDYQVTSLLIEKNTIINSEGGCMKLNYGGHNHTIQDNNMVGGHWGVQFNNDAVNYSANTGNNFQRNAIGTAWFPVSFYDLNDAAFNPFSGAGGNSDNNYYLNPYADLVGRKLNGVVTAYTLAAWRTLMGDDAASTKFASPYVYSGNYTTEQYEAIIHLNETLVDVSYTIPTGYVDKSGTTAGNSVTVPAYEGIVLIRTSSAAEVYDSFTGVNGTLIAVHSPEVGGAWTLRQGALTISSNTIVASVTGGATQTTTHSDVNVMSQASRGSTASNINLMFRHNGQTGAANETYYHLFWAADSIQLYSIAAGGTGTLITSTPQLLSASTNYYTEVRVIGSRVLVKIDGETKIDYTGLSINPSSVIHGFRQPSGTGSNTTIFAISAAS